jgi:hypothetical protein
MMAPTEKTVSRPGKGDHVEIIFYEIDMLEYCFQRLREKKWAEERDYCLCIEGFLLHYRNLIEFFGNHHGLRADRPQEWSPRRLTDAELTSIQNQDLLRDYHSLLSRYLGHCDGIRARRGRNWEYVEMYNRIAPLLKNFRHLFPSKTFFSKEVTTLGAESVSTKSSSSVLSFDPSQFSLGAAKKSGK